MTSNPSISPRKLAVLILEKAFKTDSYVETLLDVNLKRYNLQDRDRAFVAEVVYGTVRWVRYLDYILAKAYYGAFDRMPERVRRSVESGLYQYLFMGSVPDYAAVNESVKLVAEFSGMVWGRVANAVLREIMRKKELQDIPSGADDSAGTLSIRWSHPEWLVEKWVKRFGPLRAEAICKANNQRPVFGIRVNRRQTEPQQILNLLEPLDVGVQPGLYLDEFIRVERVGPVTDSAWFHQGKLTVQDESAGLVSRLVNPGAGDRILDLAAAPGGKSTHLAEIGGDDMMLVANERYPSRVPKIIENAGRLKLSTIYPVLADGRKPPYRSFHKILLDVPCSGMGVIQKRGELRWRRTPEQVKKVTDLQARLLESAAGLLEPGGVIVYSTCTVLEEENQEIVRGFLDAHPSFSIEPAHHFVNRELVTPEGFIETWPDLHSIDGSFAARLKYNA